MLTKPIADAFERYEAATATPAFTGKRDDAFPSLVNAESENERITGLLAILDDAERETIATLRQARADLESEIHRVTSDRRTRARQASEAREHAKRMRAESDEADHAAKFLTIAKADARTALAAARNAEKAANEATLAAA